MTHEWVGLISREELWKPSQPWKCRLHAVISRRLTAAVECKNTDTFPPPPSVIFSNNRLAQCSVFTCFLQFSSLLLVWSYLKVQCVKFVKIYCQRVAYFSRIQLQVQHCCKMWIGFPTLRTVLSSTHRGLAHQGSPSHTTMFGRLPKSVIPFIVEFIEEIHICRPWNAAKLDILDNNAKYRLKWNNLYL